MKTRWIAVILVILLASAGLFFRSQSNSQAASTFSCVIPVFEATIYQGPSAGWQIIGSLSYEVAEDGTLTGTLSSDDGSMTLPIIGQMEGHDISMAFDLGKAEDEETQLYIFGTGVSIGQPGECDSVIGGSLVGPMPGDSGDWGTCPPSPRLPLCAAGES